MITATSTPPVDGPLTQDHQQELALAARRAQKIRSASRVATLNGWTIGAFAILSLPFAVFSLSGAFIATGMCVVAYNEFRGRRRLMQFDPASATLLGWNQVGLAALITVYCLWMIGVGLVGTGPFVAELKALPDLEAVIGSFDEFDRIYRLLVVAVYGTIILLSVVFQGLCARYYFRRRPLIEEYVRETPGWVLDLQRATSGV